MTPYRNRHRGVAYAFSRVLLLCAIFATVFVFTSLYNPVGYAVCTLVLDDATCSNSQSITVTGVCTAGNEGNRVYVMEWWNTTGNILLESDAGTTPSGTGTPFFESFTCPSAGTMSGNASLVDTNLEGVANFTMVAAGTNELVIKDITVTSDILIGRTAGFEFILVDENDKRLSGARCVADVENGDAVPVTAASIDIVTHDGLGVFSGVTSIAALSEGTSFVLTPSCSCGVSPNGCWDEDGTSVESSAGSSSFTFDVGTWLTVNTITDKSNYMTGENLLICANVTNPENRSRQHIAIDYNYRCDDGSDTSFFRVLIATFFEERGISGNITQTQCHDFLIPDFHSIERGSTTCYAGTRVGALDEVNNLLVEYHTTSPDITITSGLVHPMMLHWERVSRLVYQVNVSTEEFIVGEKDIHVILNPLLDELDTPASSIDSFSVTYINGSVIPFSTGVIVHDLSLMTEEIDHSVVVSINGVNTSLNEVFLITINLDGGDITNTPLLLLGSTFILLIAIAEWKRDRWLYLFSSILPLMIFFFSLTNNPFSSFTEFQLDRLWILFTLTLTTYIILRAGLGDWPDRAPVR